MFQAKPAAGLLALAIVAAGCSNDAGSSGSEGGTGATAGSVSGGGGGGGTTSGGVATGGTATGGLATGGAITGGASTGSTGMGGAATGGADTGGRDTGGAGGMGGVATGGGTATGGTETGGTETGGTETGGTETGGTEAGGTEAGGTESGGTETGGTETGGTETGGTETGGTETGGTATGGEGGAAGVNGWSLRWSDEFDGTEIDASKWEHEVNCWGGGNNEDQCYVADAKNSFVADGELHIVAIKDSPSGPEGGGSGSDAIVTKGHSSARLRTLDRGDFRYGRVEARLRLPFGQGLWPAFWMLPSDSAYGGWAASGEIDIMEAINLGPGENQVYGTLHYGGAWPDNTNSGTSFIPSTNAWEAFHEYAIEWEEGEIRWFVDDTHYATQIDWYSDNGDYPAPFDQRFHLLLNVAVGGSWPGPPDASTTFPQEMLVDYVRVYDCAADPDTGHGCGTSDPGVTPL